MKDDETVGEGQKLRCVDVFNPFKKRGDVKDKEFAKFFDVLPSFPNYNSNQYLIRSVSNRGKHVKPNPPLLSRQIGRGVPRP